MLADRGIPLLFALVWLTGCAPGQAPSTGLKASPAVEVSVLSAPPASAPTLTLPARVKASEEVTLRSRLSGRVTRFVAREGDAVRSGQILVRFDAPEAERSRAAARAERAAAEWALEVAARQDARMESLFVGRVVPAADREGAASLLRSADARAAAAQARLSEVEAASEVRAPFDGVVARRHLDEGADVAPGSALLDLRSNGAAELVTAVPEGALGSLKSARFLFQIAEGAWQEARLSRVDGMTDAATRTRDAHLTPTGRVALEPGAYARVRISGVQPSALGARRVPRTSLVRRGALTGVFVVESGRAVLRWVRIGADEGEQVEVLAGLEATDSVVRDVRGLTDGATVTIVQ